jgi:hypothetical protein
MSSAAVDLLKKGIVQAEDELKELDKKRDELLRKIKELRHASNMLLVGSAPAPDKAPAPASKKDADLGEKVGTVMVSGARFAIYKRVRTEVMSAMTTKVPKGEWFKPEIIYPSVTRFFKDITYTRKYVRAYLMFMEKNGFVEHNKKGGHSSRYRWFPRFKDQTMTEEEVRKRIEEDRRALQDVMG